MSNIPDLGRRYKAIRVKSSESINPESIAIIAGMGKLFIKKSISSLHSEIEVLYSILFLL